MKGIFALLAIIGIALPGPGRADTRTVICDGCGESEYSQVAIQAAGVNDMVLVMDGQQGHLRKYIVSSFESHDGGGLFKTAFRVTPTQQEFSQFAGSVEVIDRLTSGLEACGPGVVGDLVIPDLWFDPACEAHDQCYEEGGGDDDRKDCDRNFYWDLRALGAVHNLAAMYFIAVRSTGWMYFNYGNNGWSSNNPLFGCNFLIVCDYTSWIQMPG